MADFYLTAAQQRANQIEAELAAAKADLAAYRANNDIDSAGGSVQQIANLEAERQNLASLYQNYVASQTPQAPPELSAEERAAKPIHRMDWNDVVDMTRTSKYARNIEPNDPNMIQGYREAMRRKARGE